MPMDNRDRHHHQKAKAAAHQLGLDVLDPEAGDGIAAEEWRAWAQLPATKRMIGWLAEGLVASRDAAELASIQRKTTRGLRAGKGLSNDLAKDQILQSFAADLYARALRVIAEKANSN